MQNHEYCIFELPRNPIKTMKTSLNKSIWIFFLPAIVLPFPTPAPSPIRNPARVPSGRNCSCCWLAYTVQKYIVSKIQSETLLVYRQGIYQLTYVFHVFINWPMFSRKLSPDLCFQGIYQLTYALKLYAN